MSSREAKTDFDVIPFGWACDDCEREYALCEFLDLTSVSEELSGSLSLDQIKKILHLKDHEVNKLHNFSKDDSFAVIFKAKGKCLNCRRESEVDVWLELTIDDRDSDMFSIKVSDTCILDGDSIVMKSNPGFYRGTDIAEGLNKLYLRWWFLRGEITVICPYIGQDELAYFHRIGSCIQKTINWRTNNPFKRIITRESNWDTTRKRFVSISEKVEKYLARRHGGDYYLSGRPGLLFILDTALFGTRVGKPSHLKFANYFHAKMYGSMLPDSAEMVISSYNYIDKEVMQLESLAFVESSRENFQHHILIFEQDRHMQIVPIGV